MTSFSNKTRAVIIVIALVLLSTPSIIATETTWRHPGFEVTQFDINMSRFNLTNLWMLDWIFNGTVPVSAANHSRMYQGSAGKLLVSENGGAYNPFNFNATYAAKPDLLSQLSDVIISSPLLDQILKYNGVNWMNANLATISAGAAVGFYYNGSVSDISGYETLSRIPDTHVEQDESTVVNSNTSLFEKYITSSGLGATQIEAGEWSFVTYTYVSSTSGMTELLLNVSKATSDGGNITFLFNVTTGNITSTSVTLYTINTVQQAFPINSTDRLIVNVSARTNSSIDTTVHFVHSGTQHYSNIKTPLVTRHNDLAGLQGGAAAEFYHLNLSEHGQIPTWNTVTGKEPAITTGSPGQFFSWDKTMRDPNVTADKNLSNYTNTPGFVTNSTVDKNLSNYTNTPGFLTNATGGANFLAQAQPARALDTVYQNAGTRTIFVSISITGSGTADIFAYTDTANPPTTVVANQNGAANAHGSISFMVLPGSYYKLSAGAATLISWTEWS